MRQKFDLQRYFSWADGFNSKVVKQYEEKYNKISEILDSNPKILDLADRDLKKLILDGSKDRKATYKSENLQRTLIYRFSAQKSGKKLGMITGNLLVRTAIVY